MGERIQNSVLTFTDLICNWLSENAPHWHVKDHVANQAATRTIIAPSHTPDPKPGDNNYGVIVDEGRPFVFFCYTDPLEPSSFFDLRCVYPTSPTFFSELEASIKAIDTHPSKNDIRCANHVGKFVRST